MLEGTRPVDLWMLVIEVLVLLLIAGKVIAETVHWRKKSAATARILLFW
jgi:hypothetical protein